MSEADNTNPPSDSVAYGAGGNGTGREPDGKFGPGNRFAKGNAYARQVQEIRRALFQAVTAEAVREAAEKLLEQAKAGDRLAFAELLDRTVGKAVPQDIEERLAALEEAIAERRGSWS